jgi:hypothetical protein
MKRSRKIFTVKTPWRRRSPDERQEPEQLVEETPVTEESSIDITIPRECIYKSFGKHPGPCPRCGGPLQQNYQSYLLATRRGKRITDSFITGSDAGWFCTHCPTMVINAEEINAPLQYGLPKWDVGDEFAVLGIVDLNAVPEEKRHLPFGDDNPIPLVEFTKRSSKTASGRAARRAKAARRKRTAPARQKGKQSKQKKKRRR